LNEVVDDDESEVVFAELSGDLEISFLAGRSLCSSSNSAGLNWLSTLFFGIGNVDVDALDDKDDSVVEVGDVDEKIRW